MRFYLGSHLPNWLELTSVPLFISRRRLSPRRSLPRARGPWALDSGGFSELSMFGAWQTTPGQYVDEVRRFHREIGRLGWAAIQDHMVESFILQKTGRTIVQHQASTVESYLDLSAAAPEMPWTPVLQGWRAGDYLDHVEQYARRGVDLTRQPIVGLGSICRRQATSEAESIVRQLAALGIRLHGFGMKTLGVRRVADALVSADSMAWSFAARREAPMAGCSHKNCANCIRYAMRWRANVLRALAPHWRQTEMFPMQPRLIA